MRATLNQKNFAAGQISKDLWGRTDSAKYQSGLKKLRNGFINKRGILYNSPGTQTVLPWKFPTQPTRQIPFKFSFDQQYNLIFGNEYMHVIKNGVPIFNTNSPFSVSEFPNGNNPTLTTLVAIPSSLLSSGMLVQLQPVFAPFLKNQPTDNFTLFCYNRWFIVQNVTVNGSTTTYQLTDLYGNAINSTNWGSYLGTLNINSVYEISTPYAYEDLPLLKYAQSFDILQLRHANYEPQELLYNSDTNWLIQQKLYWPSQQSLASIVSGSGGNSGGSNYYYKVSTYNLQTQQESLPGGIPVGAPGASYAIGGNTGVGSSSSNQVTIEGISYSGNVGDSVYLNIGVSYPFGGKGTLLTAYKIYSVLAKTSSTITITADQEYSGDFEFNAGTKLFTGATPSITISAVTNGFPLEFTTSGSIPFLSGDEIMIQNTGIVGIDNNTFIATEIDSTHFTIQGVNGNNYNLTTFVANQGSAGGTAVIMSDVQPTVADPITLTFTYLGDNVDNIVFLVYASQSRDGIFGFIGLVYPGANGSTVTFIDPGIPPDSTLTAKSYLPILFGPGNYPSACNFYQQRLVEFATNNNPQGLWASVVGDYNDFTVHDPIQDNDAIIMDVWSNEMQQIFDSADSGFLVLITDMGPMVAAGDSSGLFTPSTNLIKRYAFAGGAQTPRPLHIFKNIVYLEANQGAIRDLEVLVTPFYTYIDKSEDVSLFSEDLITASPITAWDYKLYPDSQIMAVRADGIALCVTYFQEQGIQAFSWMDTNDGDDQFMDVACVQEGNETFAYWSVDRETGGWIERMASRYYTDPTVNAVFTHGTATYDGRVNNGTTAVLSGAITAQGSVTATFSNSIGADFNVGWQVNFKYVYGYDQYGNELYNIARMNITSKGSNTITGTLFEAINADMIGPTISDIRVCSNVVGGLWHLNGQEVSVVADGFQIANPNDSVYPIVLTVENGSITLPNGQAFGVINVGLPYFSDVQFLDIDEEKSETFMDKFIGVHEVAIKFLETGDLWVGPNFTEYLTGKMQMDRFPFRNSDDGYLTPTKLFTGIRKISMDTQYGYGGSFCLRNIAALPMTILKVAPRVQVQS